MTSAAQVWSLARVVAGVAHGARVFGGPLQASLSPTNRCNLRCEHCFSYSPLLERPFLRATRCAQTEGREPPSPEALRAEQAWDADFDTFANAMGDLERLGTRRFQLSGNGEPFVHPRALDLMARAKAGGAFCLVNTNGTLLDEPTAEALVDMGFDELRISTLAGDAETYGRMHPGAPAGTFARIGNHIATLREIRDRRRRRRPRIVLVSIVTATNHDRLDAFAGFAATCRADGVMFRPLDDMADERVGRLALTDPQAQRVSADLARLAPRLTRQGPRHNIPAFLRVFRQQPETRELYRNVPCSYGWLAAMIEPNGDVFTCHRAWQPIGTLQQESFHDIWHGARYRAFRAEGRALPMGDRCVTGCDCAHCVHGAMNARAYRLLRSRQTSRK